MERSPDFGKDITNALRRRAGIPEIKSADERRAEAADRERREREWAAYIASVELERAAYHTAYNLEHERRDEERRISAAQIAEQVRRQAAEAAEAQRKAGKLANIDRRFQADTRRAATFLCENDVPAQISFPYVGPKAAATPRQRLSRMLLGGNTSSTGGWVVGDILEKQWVEKGTYYGALSDGMYSSTPPSEYSCNMILASGIALLDTGELYAFSTGGHPRTHSVRGKHGIYRQQPTRLHYSLTTPITARLLVQYRSAGEMLQTCSVVGPGFSEVSVDDKPAVNDLLAGWHNQLVYTASNAAWNAGIRPGTE